MFRCTICKEVAAPGVKPIFITSEAREVDYVNTRIRLDEYEREHKEIIESRGMEIVREHKSCPSCAGITPEPAKVVKVIGKKHKHEEPLPVPLRPALAAFAATKALDYIEDPIIMSQPGRAGLVEEIRGFVERNPKFVF